MKKFALAFRLYLGLIYFVFGLNGFFQFVPPPKTPLPEGAMAFVSALMGTPYFFPVLKLTETTSGFLLLSGFAAPIALVVLAPITIHIFLFHLFLTPGLEHIILPLSMVTAHVIAGASYWQLYRPLFRRQTFSTSKK